EGEAAAFLKDRSDPGPVARPLLPRPPHLVRCFRWLERLCLSPHAQMMPLDELPSPPISFSDRMSAIRSLEGDQTAAWGYHVGHWFAERFQQTLSKLGFEAITIQRSLSGHVP